MANLPTTTPAEVLDISPEGLEIANTYLQNPSIKETADELGITREMVTQTLGRREIKAYIDQTFFSQGFNNRFKLADLMDTIITKKLQELDEADMGSTKDISELLQMKHKMMTEHMAHELAVEKIRAGTVKNQMNVQINEGIGGNKYNSLIERLMNGNVIDV